MSREEIIFLICFALAIYWLIQKYIYNKDKTLKEIINAINNRENIFITGGAGTGKSYTLNYLRKKYDIDVTSTTGISALQVEGQTIHSWAGIGIADKPIDFIVNRILNRSTLAKQIINCKILAIDEISMLDGTTFDYINDVLKQVRCSNRPFGGIQVLIFGDFYQLPPVKVKENGFAFESKAWQELNLRAFILNKVHRQNDKNFITVLNNLRVNKLTYDDVKFLTNKQTPLIYSDTPHFYCENKDVDIHNDLKLKELNTAKKIYISIDTLCKKNIKISNIDQRKNLLREDIKILEKLDEFCKASAELELKLNCKVILIKNIDTKRGLVNGSRGIIEQFYNDSILVNFDNGEKLSVERYKFEYYSNGELIATREQFPLMLAYALTIHKSQGMTLSEAYLNLNNIFAEGQAYVAISRVKSPDGLFLSSFNHKAIGINAKVENFYTTLQTNTEKRR